MKVLLICAVTALCVLGEHVFAKDLECEQGVGCNNRKELNPYKEAARNSPWMRHRAYGYLQVRPGVHLFYQLFYANGSRNGAEDKPLIIWIQGGPGFAASGIGNFAEIGPLTMDFKPRNHTWVKERNVLLIDHPVDVGFSYATNDSLLVSSDREMAVDLSKAIKIFLRRRKEFRKTPTYLIGQSYGGKICPRLAVYLYTAINNNELEMNFKGIGIGGGWVNPRESSLMQPDFLYHLGAIDQNLYLEAKQIAVDLAQALDREAYEDAQGSDEKLFKTLNRDRFINFNKFNTPTPFDELDALQIKINLYVKPTLRNVNQSIEWNYISNKAYRNLQKDFSVPSYSFLETILGKTELKVVVYNGNMDIVTPIAGASNWVHKLKWPGAADFAKAKRSEISGDGNGFYKEWKQLSFWSVFGAGHWVPEDNPRAMEQILNYLTSDTSLKSET